MLPPIATSSITRIPLESRKAAEDCEPNCARSCSCRNACVALISGAGDRVFTWRRCRRVDLLFGEALALVLDAATPREHLLERFLSKIPFDEARVMYDAEIASSIDQVLEGRATT
jgi:hypothetical protein